MPGPATGHLERVLVKLSGEGLGAAGEACFDADRLTALTRELAQVRAAGAQVGVVVGGGNLLRGEQLTPLGLDRALADRLGMLATVQNGLVLEAVLRREGLPVRHLPAAPYQSITGEVATPSRAREALVAGEVVIFSGGTGNPFFTTDTAGALRALEIQATALIKATKVDGVFDRDPVLDPAARRFTHLTYDEVLQRRLGVMDLTAVTLCRERGLPIFVCDLFVPGNLGRLVRGEMIGTRIDAGG